MVKRITWIFALAGAVSSARSPRCCSRASPTCAPRRSRASSPSARGAFLSRGIEGGLALHDRWAQKTRAVSICLSTIPSLAAWGVLWLSSPQQQIGASIALFIAVWCADLWLAHQGLIPSWFVDMRTAVTALVCVILGVAYWLL
jgi:hypothetical protein